MFVFSVTTWALGSDFAGELITKNFKQLKIGCWAEQGQTSERIPLIFFQHKMRQTMDIDVNRFSSLVCPP
jgi:hypothetical protein